MSLLDIYLQKNGKKRYDVFKETGTSQQQLASVNNKNVNSNPKVSVSDSLIQQIYLFPYCFC